MVRSGACACAFTHGEDNAIAQFVEKGTTPVVEPSQMSESQIHELRLQLVALSGAGLPDVDYSGIEFMDTVVKGWGSKDSPKAPKQPKSKQEPADLVGRQASFAVKPPRLVPRFPWVSNVSSKITAMKKKYRMKKMLARRPHLAKPAGGVHPVETSRPRPVKSNTAVAAKASVKPVKASTPHFPKPPAPAKTRATRISHASASKARGISMTKSMAVLPEGNPIEVLIIQ
jgi:hypothetical protein